VNEAQHTALSDVVLKARSRILKLREMTEAAASKKIVARFVGVGLEVIERTRCRKKITGLTQDLEQSATQLVEGIIEASEELAVRSRMTQQHLAVENATLRRDLQIAKAELEFERTKFTRKMSKLHEEIAFEEHEMRLRDDESTRALAKIDADSTMRCDLLAEHLLAESRSRLLKASDKRHNEANEAELRLAVLESEMKDRLCSSHVEGRRRVEDARRERLRRFHQFEAEVAAELADIVSDNEAMEDLVNASVFSSYGSLFDRISQITPLADDSDRLLRLAVGPTLRSETPLRYSLLANLSSAKGLRKRGTSL
jgi:hypothetical protein